MGSHLEVNRAKLESASYRRLTRSQCETLHDASMEIIESIGMRFDDAEALELLKKGGARLVEENLVRIPQRMVEWAIRTAPKCIRLYDRTGALAMRLAWGHSYYGPITDTLYVPDRVTGERRLATLDDLCEMVKVCDALPNIDYVMSVVLASDAPVHSADVHQVRVMLEHTSKPIVFVTYTGEMTRRVIELGEAVAGSAEELRDRPFLVNYINITAPLHHNADSIQKLFWSVDHGIPIIYRPSLVTRGYTTPLTMASFVALNNAGSLAGLVLAQLREEGAPFIREGGPAGTVDLRTMVGCYGRPEGRGFQADLGQLYDLPTLGLAGGSDSKIVDGQAVMEMALTLAFEALSGNSLVHGISALEGGKAAAIELLPIGDEIVGWLRQALRGLEINEETLALAEIREHGLRNLYIGSDHAVRHCREDWIPSLLDSRNYAGWTKSGAGDLIERARKRVEEILRQPRDQQSLSQAILRRMDEIVAQADVLAPAEH